MSASYAWRPLSPLPPPQGSFDIGLADMIARRILNDHDSTRSVDRSVIDGQVMSKGSSWVGWLEGVSAARKPGDDIGRDAMALLEAIAEHEDITLEYDR